MFTPTELMKTKYKLIAIDIDGTLTNTKGKITERTKRTVHRAAQGGATVVIATGRRFSTAKPRIWPLELPAALLAVHNGAILKRLNGDLIFHQLLSRGVAQQVVRVARELGLCPIIFEGTQDEANIRVEDYGDRIDGWQRGYLEENQQHLVRVADLTVDLPDDVIEVICVVPAQDVHEIAETFRSRLDGRIKPILVMVNDGKRAFVGLSHAKVGKHQPLRYLAERMGIDRSEILAIGDNYNDLDMLRFAGTGVVMANAADGVKQMGFHTTASNDADGVAEALERFVLCGNV